MAAVLKEPLERQVEAQPDFTPPQIDVRQIYTLDQAIALLDEWIAAYEDLERAYARLHHKYSKTKQYLELVPDL